jgi:hypothetical protein
LPAMKMLLSMVATGNRYSDGEAWPQAEHSLTA